MTERLMLKRHALSSKSELLFLLLLSITVFTVYTVELHSVDCASTGMLIKLDLDIFTSGIHCKINLTHVELK